MSTAASLALSLYLLMLLLMLIYGLNSVLLVVLHALRRRQLSPAPPPPDPAPVVTVQLAVYNEENVVVRLLEAASRLEWPKDRLQLQLLDDSTDGTPEIAAQAVAALRERGFDVQHLRRQRRDGYKAGALQAGMAQARGELLALFDADFVPPPDFLIRSVGRFQDPKLAAVQGRWTHLNRDWSALTRAQALAIDGHFGVEQGARHLSGWFLNFNGSAGVWRKAAIEDAGGWSGDTLTEDLDLSYRAQLRGWTLVYDPELVCPSELPTDLAAFKSQQRRWATGSMQTALKLLPAIWRSRASLAARLQATLHLTHYAVHPLIALSAVLSLPCILLTGAAAAPRSPWTLLLPFALALSGPTLLHIYAQRVLEGQRLRARDLGVLTLLGLGIAVSNTRAVLAAFRRGSGEFVRTPKLGLVDRRDQPARAYRAPADDLGWAEATLAIYCLVAAAALAAGGVYEAAPFLALDAAAFATVASMGRRAAAE